MALDVDKALAAGYSEQEIMAYLRTQEAKRQAVATPAPTTTAGPPTAAPDAAPAGPGTIPTRNVVESVPTPETASGATPGLPVVPPEYQQGGAKAIDSTVNPVKLGAEGATQAMQQELASRVTGDRNMAGVGTVVLQAIQSFKQLVGRDPSPQELAELKTIAEDPHGGKVGNIVGNVAALFLPSTYAARGAEAGAKLLSAFPKVQAAIKSATVPAIAAGENALLNPVQEGETRAGNAGTAALLGKGGELFMKTLGRTATGLVEPSKQALEYLKQNIVPTISQGGKGAMGAIVGGVEDLTRRVLPKSWMSGMDRAEAETMETAARRAQPIPVGDIMPARGAFPKSTQLQFDTAYNAELAGKHIPMPAGMRQQAVNDAQRELSGMTPAEKTAFSTDVDSLLSQIPTRGRADGMVWKKVQADVRERIRENMSENTADAARKVAAWRKVEDQLMAARNARLNPVEQARLDRLDDQYGHFKLLEVAGNKPTSTPEAVPLKNLISAVEEKTPSGVKWNAEGRYQDLTEPAKTLFEQTLRKGSKDELPQWMTQAANWGIRGGLVGTGAMNPAMVPVIGAAGLLGKVADSRAGSRALFGDFEAQKRMAQLMKDYPEFMKALAASGGATKD